MPKAVILRNLDAMAAVKLNVLHLHLSDDQGFRVESRLFPKLHQDGSGGSYYTQADIDEIVAYAADRGIRVVPEFDLPGHSTSWLVAYPELGSAPGPYTLAREYGISRRDDRSDARGGLRVPRPLHRRDGAAVPRSVLPHRRRRGERQDALELERAHPAVHARAQARREPRAPGVLRPAAPEDPRESWASRRRAGTRS